MGEREAPGDSRQQPLCTNRVWFDFGRMVTVNRLPSVDLKTVIMLCHNSIVEMILYWYSPCLVQRAHGIMAIYESVR